MANVPITPGAGANIHVDVVGADDYQVVKLDFGAAGASLPAVADVSGFLKVNIAGQALGAITVNNPTAANLKVDASGATVPISAASAIPVSAPVLSPVSVRISNGAANVDTLPVSGTVTANQGTAAAVASAWPIKISDGTNTAPLDGSNGNALKVSVVASVTPGSVTDKGAFTEGTTVVVPIAGEYNTAPTTPASGQAAACQITQNRGLHVNLRNAAGTEIGTSGTPVRIDPVGTTTQPVSGTVTATLSASVNAGVTAVTVNYNTGGGTQNLTMMGLALPGNAGAVAGGTSTNPIRIDPTGTTTQPVNVASLGGNAVSTVANGVQKVALADNAGAAIAPVITGAGNPLAVIPQPTPSGFWKNAVTFSASQTDISLRTPAAGKTAYVEGYVITVITSGVFKLYDQTNAAASMIYQGTPPVGAIIAVTPHRPIPLSALNNILRYSTGTGATGDIAVWGYDA